MDQPAQIINEPTPPPVSVDVQPSPSTPKSKKGTLITFLVILGLILIGGLVYAGMQIRKKQSQIPVLPTPVPTGVLIPTTALIPTEVAIPTLILSNPTPDPTAGWKTYTSDRITFKYPESLTLEERQKNYVVLLSNPSNPQSVLVSIDARLTGSYTNYDSAVNSTKAGLTNVQAKEIAGGVKISGKVGPGYSEGQKITVALFRYQQGAIEAETTSIDPVQLQVFDQILSTFKFLE